MGKGLRFDDLYRTCTPDTYTAMWADGFVGDIWADELCPNGPADFYRPDPPLTPNHKVR